MIQPKLIHSHLPEATVKPLTGRIAKWLGPGGVGALTELCNFRHIHIHPESKYLPEKAEALIQAVTGERGCYPEIGNYLPGLLCSAGLDVEISDYRAEMEANKVFASERQRRPYVEDCFLLMG